MFQDPPVDKFFIFYQWRHWYVAYIVCCVCGSEPCGFSNDMFRRTMAPDSWADPYKTYFEDRVASVRSVDHAAAWIVPYGSEQSKPTLWATVHVQELLRNLEPPVTILDGKHVTTVNISHGEAATATLKPAELHVSSSRRSSTPATRERARDTGFGVGLGDTWTGDSSDPLEPPLPPCYLRHNPKDTESLSASGCSSATSQETYYL